MRVIILILTFLGICFLGFKLDQYLFYLVINEIPETEWIGVIKICIGAVLFIFTGGLIIGISGFLTTLVGIVIKDRSNNIF